MSKTPVISIIDDDASVRVATDRLVRSLGYVARTFASAEEFLRSPYVNESSCLIVDVQMPGMSGVDLQVRLSSEGRAVPVILITAFPEEGIRTKAMKAGAVCFLSKPFDGPVLIDCIDSALKQQRA